MSVKKQQLKTLFNLLSRGAGTWYGKKYKFSDIDSYPDYSDRLPIRFYEDFAQETEKIKSGERDLLWPGAIQKFAVSAGTTGKGKHLPLSSERLKSDRRFMRKLTLTYLKQQPNILKIFGKHLSLPGSVVMKNGILIGEISGFTARQSPWWLRPFQLENPTRLTELSFDEKFQLILEASIRKNIKVITAVPSWILTLFQQVLDRTGKSNIAEVWPELNLLICGGVKLANYRSFLDKLTGGLDPHFIETYGSSEGYFAFTDRLGEDDLGLVHDNGIFYEFIPDPLPDMESLSIQPTVPLWEVETGLPYALVVTNNSGLWRYAVNDIVEFTSVDPPRIRVKGRLSEMLDDFGEGLYLYEAEEALNRAVGQTRFEKGNFTVGGYLESEKEQPRHYWFIQFFEPVHTDTLKRVADAIDLELRNNNRHYAIRRESGALAAPVVRSITQADINSWYDYNNSEKAQSKLPKLLRNDEDIEFFLKK